MKTAPIALFVYNRLSHTKKTVEALRQNELAQESDLYVFSDGPKNEPAAKPVDQVRQYVRDIVGFRSVSITELNANYGLAKSIITGVTEICRLHGRVIVVEDDIVTSRYFLKFMNDALHFYENDLNIFSIAGYNHPNRIMRIPDHYTHDIYFNYRNSCWGWGTWENRWIKADWDVKDYAAFRKSRKKQQEFNRGGDDLTDSLAAQVEGRIDSWAIRWSYSHYRNQAVCVHPVLSYVNNIGNDGSGIHCGITDKYENDLAISKASCRLLPFLSVDETIMAEFRKVYRYTMKFRLRRAVMKLLGW